MAGYNPRDWPTSRELASLDEPRATLLPCCLHDRKGLATTALAVINSPGKQQTVAKAVSHHATGSFEVAIKPESENWYAMTKTFSGALAGTSKGTMIGDSAVNANVALERFEGTLDGNKGGFVLLHRGYMNDADGMNLDIMVAPNSGTGELKGIRGKLAIEIKGEKHSCDLAYSSPSR